MAILTKGTTFTSTQQVTSTNLNNLVDNAAFVSGSSGTTDDSTLEVNGSGQLQAKDGGITAAKLSSNSVSTAKIVDGAVTTAKLSTGAPTWNGTSTLTLSFSDVSTTIEVVNTSSTATNNPAFKSTNYSGSSSGHPLVLLQRARGTSASPTAVQATDVLGEVVFSGHNGTDFEQASRIRSVAAENFSGSAEGNALLFLTTPTGSTSSTEAARISPSGALLVGTGTDVASVLFRVASTTRASMPFPVMTTTQRDAISSPQEGSFVYNTTTNKLNFYNGSSWEAVTSA